MLDGIPLRLVDTAGLRETHDAVEKLGVDRAERLVDEADLSLLVVDVAAGGWAPPYDVVGGRGAGRVLVVLNKIDLLPRGGVETLPRGLGELGGDAVCVSAATGEGIAELKAAIARKICGGITTRAGLGVAVSARHHALVLEALDAIGRARGLCGDDGAAVLCAQLLRSAAEALAAITGRVYSEDLLDGIFSRFCIGK